MTPEPVPSPLGGIESAASVAPDCGNDDTPGTRKREMATAKFDGCDTITIPAGGNPIWIKAGGMTIQITPAEHGDCDHLTVDVWRGDDQAMAEPWSVEFDGESARIL